MSTWLEIIKMEVGKLDVNDLIEPTAEMTEQDHEVDKLDDDLKKLYGYAQWLRKQMMEKVMKAEFEKYQERRELYAQQAFRLNARYEALMEIFWISLKDAFDLWKKPSVGVRRGWKVVWHDSRHSCIFTALKDILGISLEEE